MLNDNLQKLEMINIFNRYKLDTKTLQPMTPKSGSLPWGDKLRKSLNLSAYNLGNIAKSDYGKYIGQGVGTLSTIIPSQSEDPTTNLVNEGLGTVSDIAMSIPGKGQIVGLAMKASGLIGKGVNAITGGALTMDNSTSGIDKVLSSDYLNLSAIGLFNKATSSKVEGTDQDLANLAGSYGSSENIDDYERGGLAKGFDKLFNLFRKKKKPTKVEQQKQKVEGAQSRNVMKAMTAQQANKDMLAGINTTSNVVQKNIQQLSGGFSPEALRVLSAKRGDILTIKNAKRKAITKFKEGGSFNVIVDGALHARKHNLDIEDITSKGVPVISYEEGGEVVQHAEVEREEIIFNKELTSKIEDLYNKYKDTNNDDILIEAGKLLTFELLENTVDNALVIDKV